MGCGASTSGPGNSNPNNDAEEFLVNIVKKKQYPQVESSPHASLKDFKDLEDQRNHSKVFGSTRPLMKTGSESGDTLVSKLCSYVPYMVTKHYRHHPELLDKPKMKKSAAALLFADISGFTPLTEKLANYGKQGAELLSKHLNNYFAILIQMIQSHGGDIIKFAGDALFVLFTTKGSDGEGKLAVSVQRAAQCALHIQKDLSEFSPVEGVVFRLHCSIAAGDIFGIHIGSMDRWEFLFAGTPLHMIRDTEEAIGKAGIGKVFLAPQAWKLASDRLEGKQFNKEGVVELLGVKSGKQLAPEALPPAVSIPEMETPLKSYIPDSALKNLGQARWIAELRKVSVLFIQFPDFHYENEKERKVMLEKLQIIITAVQTALKHYEGVIRQFIIDDKGTVLIAAFGLPHYSHEDDPLRAVKSAMEIQQTLKASSIQTSIGITTGTAFCGSIGSSKRCEYSIVGDTVNLSARLMVAASKMGKGILVDSATHQAATTARNSNRTFTFKALDPIMVKGKEKPIPVFKPVGQMNSKKGDSLEIFLGRKEELKTMQSHMSTLSKQKKGLLVVVEGEVGIGKSKFCQQVRNNSESLTTIWLQGNGDAAEKASAYLPFKGVFKSLVNQLIHRYKKSGKSLSSPSIAVNNDDAPLATTAALAIQHAYKKYRKQGEQKNTLKDGSRDLRVLRLIETMTPELIERASLLNTVITLDVPESPSTKALSTEDRKKATQDLLFSVLKAYATQCESLVLLLEDIQWFDPSSWSLMERIVNEGIPSTMVVASLRAQSQVPELFKVLANDTIKLGSLSQAESTEFISQKISVPVSGIPKELSQLIYEKARGNPLFIEELVYNFRDSNLFDIKKDTVTFDAQNAAKVSFTDSIQAVITNRIDKLPFEQQMVVKVASVIGKTFSSQLLFDIFPIRITQETCTEHLRDLCEKDFFKKVETMPKHFSFNNSITQEVSYDMLLFSHKSSLHISISEWFEHQNANDLEPHYPTLAHHLFCAVTLMEQPTRNMKYVQRAINYNNKCIEIAIRKMLPDEEFVARSKELIKLLPAHQQEEQELAMMSAQGANFLV